MIHFGEKLMRKSFIAYLQNEDGATAIEYGVLVALVAIAIVAGARSVGSSINTTFNNVAMQNNR